MAPRTLLSVGEVSETVIVEGNIVPLVNVTDPTDGATLDAKRISELPINGRNLNTLLENVTPGLEGINDALRMLVVVKDKSARRNKLRDATIVGREVGEEHPRLRLKGLVSLCLVLHEDDLRGWKSVV